MLQLFDVIWNGPDIPPLNIPLSNDQSFQFMVREPLLRSCSNENTRASHAGFANVAGTLPSMNRRHNSPPIRFHRRLPLSLASRLAGLHGMCFGIHAWWWNRKWQWISNAPLPIWDFDWQWKWMVTRICELEIEIRSRPLDFSLMNEGMSPSS